MIGRLTYMITTFHVHDVMPHVAFRLAVVNDVSLITKFEFERETRITDPSDTAHTYIFTHSHFVNPNLLED
jgi:hypothetical protein